MDNKQFLYFLQALCEIDRKYLGYPPQFGKQDPLFIDLLKWQKYTVEWNKNSLPKMQALKKELEALGLEVSDITELEWGYNIVISLPKNPTSTLLYDKA